MKYPFISLKTHLGYKGNPTFKVTQCSLRVYKELQYKIIQNIFVFFAYPWKHRLKIENILILMGGNLKVR